ncbi:MAG: limC [Nocardioides sp.]|nr:limC [Nocardioides sp.]
MPTVGYPMSAPEAPDPARDWFAEFFETPNPLPVLHVQPVNISNATLFLVSDEARCITGGTLPVDADYTLT